MNKADILSDLNLGNEIAEQDKNLSKYYITTNATKDFVNDRYDIIRGSKGSGKSAMLIAVQENQNVFTSLDGIKLIPMITLKGNSDFQKAFNSISDDNTDVDQLKDAWKIFFINTIWKNCNEEFACERDRIKNLLEINKLIAKKKSLFEEIRYCISRVKVTYTPNGIDEFGLQAVNKAIEKDDRETNYIDFNNVFDELDNWLSVNGKRIWVLLDRLDDAFPDKSPKDKMILKSLLLAYKDIYSFDNFKVKIFVRDDIFDMVTDKGFTSLTHVSAKTMPSLRWEKDSIEKLLVERLLHNPSFVEWIDSMGLKTNCDAMTPDERRLIINKIMREQIDTGKSNPDSVGWIINHIKDGKGHFTPRDFLKVFDKARTAQLIRYSNGNDSETDYLISPAAIKCAWKQVSEDKLKNELKAEYPKCESWIMKFKNHKAEHTAETLESILGTQWKSRTNKLVEIGFIEEKGKSYKIPYLYQPALDIKQGKEELGAKKKRKTKEQT